MRTAANRDVSIKTMCPAVDVCQTIARRKFATCNFLILHIVECVYSMNVAHSTDWTEHCKEISGITHCSDSW